MSGSRQSSVFRGIYEFEDPSGCLIAARIPHIGSVDLYSGTVIIVRPNQCAFFMYQGKIADVLLTGTHQIETGNLPILTRLANWRFGFKSPLRCEIWYFSSQVYTGRRWGTTQPVIHSFGEMTSVPIRAYGNFNIVVNDPRKFYSTLLGSRTSYDISELESFLQGQILELLPEALSAVKSIESLNKSQNQVSKVLQNLVNRVIDKYGISLVELQVLSIVPTQEVLKALGAKAAMNIIGNKQEYLLYQAANSLNEIQGLGGESGSTKNDPMQMMLGMMLGKSLLSADYREKERVVSAPEKVPVSRQQPLRPAKRFCSSCSAAVRQGDRFCSSCGGKLA